MCLYVFVIYSCTMLYLPPLESALFSLIRFNSLSSLFKRSRMKEQLFARRNSSPWTLQKRLVQLEEDRLCRVPFALPSTGAVPQNHWGGQESTWTRLQVTYKMASHSEPTTNLVILVSIFRGTS